MHRRVCFIEIKTDLNHPHSSCNTAQLCKGIPEVWWKFYRTAIEKVIIKKLTLRELPANYKLPLSINFQPQNAVM
jgi:hypothetical protein